MFLQSLAYTNKYEYNYSPFMGMAAYCRYVNILWYVKYRLLALHAKLYVEKIILNILNSAMAINMPMSLEFTQQWLCLYI